MYMLCLYKDTVPNVRNRTDDYVWTHACVLHGTTAERVFACLKGEAIDFD